MKDSGKTIKEMAEENNFGKTAASMKATGKITLPMEMAG
jgi:hypothetical protein